jgi:hypothetical protein
VGLAGLGNLAVFHVSSGIGVLILAALSTTLTTTMVVLAQNGLNSIWRSRRADVPIRETHLSESLLTVLGLLTWVFDFAAM